MKFSLQLSLWKNGSNWKAGSQHFITLNHFTFYQNVVCDNDLTDKELFDALKGIPNKSPSNDGLTKESYETFWDELKKFFYKCNKVSLSKKALSTSQRQAVIKLVEKMIAIKHRWRIGDQFPYLM